MYMCRYIYTCIYVTTTTLRLLPLSLSSLTFLFIFIWVFLGRSNDLHSNVTILKSQCYFSITNINKFSVDGKEIQQAKINTKK